MDEFPHMGDDSNMDFMSNQHLLDRGSSDFLLNHSSMSPTMEIEKAKREFHGFLPEVSDIIYQIVSDGSSGKDYESCNIKEKMDRLHYQILENGNLFLSSSQESVKLSEEDGIESEKLQCESDMTQDFDDMPPFNVESSSDSDVFDKEICQIKLPGCEKLLETSMDILEKNCQAVKIDETQEEKESIPQDSERGRIPSSTAECEPSLPDSSFFHQLRQHIEHVMEDIEDDDDDSGDDDSDSDDDHTCLKSDAAAKSLLHTGDNLKSQGHNTQFTDSSHPRPGRPPSPPSPLPAPPPPPPLIYHGTRQPETNHEASHSTDLLRYQTAHVPHHYLYGCDYTVLPFPHLNSYRNESGTLVFLSEKNGKAHYHEISEEMPPSPPEEAVIVSQQQAPQYTAAHQYTLQQTLNSQQDSYNIEPRNSGRNFVNRLSLNSSGSEEEYSPPAHADYEIQINEATREVTVPVSIPTAAEVHAAFLRVRDETINGAGLCLGRMQHNAKERARRARIKISCDQLRQLVPGMTEKTDKATVFEFTVHYLGYLKSLIGKHFDKEFLRHVASCGLDQED